MLEDLAFAMRRLVARPGFLVLAAISMAVGIGANAALVSVLYQVFWSPIGVERPQELVRIYSARGTDFKLAPTEEHAAALRESTTTLRSVGAFKELMSAQLRFGEIAGFARGVAVDGEYFEVLGVRAAQGRLLEPEDPPDVAVLSHAAWLRLGAPGDIVGARVLVNAEPMTVIGVAEAAFRGLELAREAAELVWVPWEVFDRLATHPTRLGPSLVGRLAPESSIVALHSELEALSQRLTFRFDDQALVALPLRQTLFGDASWQRMVRASGIVGAVAGLILLLTAANVGNLVLSRGLALRHEMTIRRALGAGRWRLGRQAFAEVLVLGAGASLLGLFAAWLLLHALWRLRTPSLAIETLDVKVGPLLAFATLGLGLLMTLVLGGGAALTAARGRAQALPAATGHRRSGRLAGALVVVQVAAAASVLLGTAVLMQSLARLRSVDLGFDPTRVLLAELDFVGAGLEREQEEPAQRAIESAVLALPGVERAAVSTATFASPMMVVLQPPGGSGIVGGSGASGGSSAPGASGPQMAFLNQVDGGYFATLGIDLLDGRSFTEGMDAAADADGGHRSLVVSAALARRLWPEGGAVGRSLSFYGGDYEVVGVVEDVTVSHPAFGGGMEHLYLPLGARPTPRRFLNVRVTGSMATALARTGGSRQHALFVGRRLDLACTRRRVAVRSARCSRFEPHLRRALRDDVGMGCATVARARCALGARRARTQPGRSRGVARAGAARPGSGARSWSCRLGDPIPRGLSLRGRPSRSALLRNGGCGADRVRSRRLCGSGAPRFERRSAAHLAARAVIA